MTWMSDIRAFRFARFIIINFGLSSAIATRDATIQTEIEFSDGHRCRCGGECDDAWMLPSLVAFWGSKKLAIGLIACSGG